MFLFGLWNYFSVIRTHSRAEATTFIVAQVDGHLSVLMIMFHNTEKAMSFLLEFHFRHLDGKLLDCSMLEQSLECVGDAIRLLPLVIVNRGL